MRNDWLAQRLKEIGKTGQGLANALGINKSRISEIIGGRRGVKADEIITIAAYLEMNERDVISLLSGRRLEPSGSLAEQTPSSAYAAPRVMVQRIPQPRYTQGAYAPEPTDQPATPSMPLDVPVYGTAIGGSDGDFEMTGEVIDRVRRPAGLMNARNAFALYVVGSSMAPRFDEGDLIVVHPGRPPVAGCDVVVELQDKDEFGHHKALLRIYRGKTPSLVLLAQLEPVGDVEIPLEQVKQIHRVLRTNELLGI